MRPNEIASGKWGYVLPALGVTQAFLKNRHGPCPMCGGKDRFRYDDKDGRGSWICNQCGAGDGYKLLQELHGWDFPQALAEVKKVVGSAPVEQRPVEQLDTHKMALIRRTWDEARPVEYGDPVEMYLRRRVGVSDIPAAIRYHAKLAYKYPNGQVGYLPSMVAKVVDVSGLGVSLHRTYLTLDGHKADVDSPKKVMSGKPIDGAAIRLGPISNHIGIAEGIETAFAASALFEHTVWSVISSSGIKSFTPPEEITRITIYADNDEKFGGQSAAYALAHKLACAGFDVGVRVPTVVGWDWVDELQHA